MDNNADDLALVEKTIETIKDIATSITANSAIGPKPDPEQVAETTNEQLYVPPSEPELAIAHRTHMEDVVAAAAAPKKKRKAPVRQAPPKKSAAKKSSKKVAKKSAKKTKSSAGRKAVGKKNKTAKKVAKKKKTKKSKR
jgi:hypothetical protein